MTTTRNPATRKGRPRRRLVPLALLAVLLLAAMPIATQDAEADPRTRCGTEHRYYSDPGMTNLVGMQTWSCSCSYSAWGEITFYREITELPCGC